jgi:hypothetical protein
MTPTLFFAMLIVLPAIVIFAAVKAALPSTPRPSRKGTTISQQEATDQYLAEEDDDYESFLFAEWDHEGEDVY